MHRIYTIMFFFSIALTLAAIAATLVFGLNFGVDFRGGTIMEIEFSGNFPAGVESRVSPEEIKRPDISQVEKIFADNFPSLKAGFSLAGDKGLIIKLAEISEQDHQDILAKLRAEFKLAEFEEKRFDSVGPVIGEELKNKSLTAIILVLLGVITYIAFVFRKMSVVLSPWAMGMAAIAALFHDVIIPIGVFAILGRYYNVEISAVFVAAILTILGYSVSDTVVVFDRVRENVIRNRIRESFGRIVHVSILQTLARSLNTTLTTLLSLVAIFLFGGESLKYFALALIMGIFLGAYSSIFVASPILVWWSGLDKKK